MKKLVSLVLAALMLLSICPLAVADEPVHIVVSNYSITPASNDEAYKLVQQKILEETGVLVDVVKLTGTNDTERINAMLAGGEQLDGWFGSWQTYANYGMCTPITDLINEHGQDILKAWDEYGGMACMYDANNDIWGIQVLFTARAFYKAFVRQDYLDQLGMAVPTTIEELNNYLYAVKALDPSGNGETIPMITRGGSVDVLAYQFLGGYTPYGFSWWLDGEELKPYFLQEGYVDFLKQIQQWYVDGILHKEQFSWDTATVRQHIASGRVACAAAYGTDCTGQGYNFRQATGGKGVWTDCKVGLTGPNGELAQTQIKGKDTGLLFNVKSDKAHQEALMKVINWMYADWENFCTGMYGIRGVHWDYDASFENAEIDHVTKLLEKSGEYSGQEYWIAPGLNEFKCVQYDADGVRNLHNEYLEQQLYVNSAKAPVDLFVYWDTTAVSENVDTLGDINRMLKEEQIKFMTGARDLGEWDQFVAELYDAGLQDYIDEYTRQWNEATK